jgi:hypothetical protein
MYAHSGVSRVDATLGTVGGDREQSASNCQAISLGSGRYWRLSEAYLLEERYIRKTTADGDERHI